MGRIRIRRSRRGGTMSFSWVNKDFIFADLPLGRVKEGSGIGKGNEGDVG